MCALARRALWSEPFSRLLGDAIPDNWHSAALGVVKAIHTVLFASVGAAIAVFVWDGICQRPSRRAAYALGIAVAETGIYLSNNQVCPLTPLAEQMGAERGSVADIFLPDWASRRIPIGSGSILVLGLVLHAIAWLRGRWRIAPLH